jgi:hypothetical protein
VEHPCQKTAATRYKPSSRKRKAILRAHPPGKEASKPGLARVFAIIAQKLHESIFTSRLI